MAAWGQEQGDEEREREEGGKDEDVELGIRGQEGKNGVTLE